MGESKEKVAGICEWGTVGIWTIIWNSFIKDKHQFHGFAQLWIQIILVSQTIIWVNAKFWNEISVHTIGVFESVAHQIPPPLCFWTSKQLQVSSLLYIVVWILDLKMWKALRILLFPSWWFAFIEKYKCFPLFSNF